MHQAMTSPNTIPSFPPTEPLSTVPKGSWPPARVVAPGANTILPGQAMPMEPNGRSTLPQQSTPATAGQPILPTIPKKRRASNRQNPTETNTLVQESYPQPASNIFPTGPQRASEQFPTGPQPAPDLPIEQPIASKKRRVSNCLSVEGTNAMPHTLPQ